MKVLDVLKCPTSILQLLTVTFFCMILVAGNMSTLPGAATPPGQPQPSPSQQGQFMFTSPVPQIPGQPQGAGHHQGQVAAGPTQFPPPPVVYIPNANASSSAASAVSYIPGNYGFLQPSQMRGDIFFQPLAL